MKETGKIEELKAEQAAMRKGIPIILHMEDIKVGAIGYVFFKRINQVIDGQTAIVEIVAFAAFDPEGLRYTELDGKDVWVSMGTSGLDGR